MSGKNLFTELAKAKIQDKRNIVISKIDSKSGYTIAQQLVVEEGRRQTAIFMKGAIHVDTLNNLYELRDAINEAIKKEEDNQG